MLKRMGQLADKIRGPQNNYDFKKGSSYTGGFEDLTIIPIDGLTIRKLFQNHLNIFFFKIHYI